MQCWQMEPKGRPTFKEIYSTLSQFIECEAGYLQFGCNPFYNEDGEEGGGENNNVEVKKEEKGEKEMEELI